MVKVWLSWAVFKMVKVPDPPENQPPPYARLRAVTDARTARRSGPDAFIYKRKRYGAGAWWVWCAAGTNKPNEVTMYTLYRKVLTNEKNHLR